jgi:hypothetical protein
MFDALNVDSYRIPPPKEWAEGSYVRVKLGQKVLWHDRKDGGYHLSADELEPYRLLGDGSVDRILKLMDDDGSPLGPGEDLLQLLEEARKKDVSLRSDVEKEMSAFLDKYEILPSWVNEEQLKRGQDVFLAYLPAASLSLYYRSLVAGFSIPKIAAVIRATSYLAPPSRPDQVLQRLLDTGELTTACTGLGLDAMLPRGVGWKTALHVRFLHAKVRFALMKRGGKKKWDVEKYGIPINQEDMAATTLAFSVNVLFGIDLISGFSLSEQERLDYLALWRYIGYLLGVETEGEERISGEPKMDDLPPLDPCGPGFGLKPSPILHSNGVLQSIIFHLLEPDKSSVEIAHHLLKITDRRPPSMSMKEIPDDFYRNELFYLRCFNCRLMIGNPLADALDLPLHPSRWTRIKISLKSTITLSLIRVYTATAMRIPFAKRWIIERHRRALVYFHEAWSKSHTSKMAKALATNEKASILEEIADNNDAAKVPEYVHTAGTSVCPFAMTALPS